MIKSTYISQNGEYCYLRGTHGIEINTGSNESIVKTDLEIAPDIDLIKTLTL